MNYANLTLHTDLYQLNMMYGYWKKGKHNDRCVFEMFFRKLPFGNGFAVFAGLERLVTYINQLRFEEEDIDFLRRTQGYDEEFFELLRNFSFTGNIYSVREGEIVFAHEPLVRVEARAFEAQLIETALLNFINYQTLIATKAARVRQAAGEDRLMEFGSRRAQEADAAIWGTRAAYIGGFDATSNLRAGKLFGMPVAGTMAHSWVQMFDSELEAFRAYAEARPESTVLLVDTFDTLLSGIPKAIIVARQMETRGHRMKGVRLDSGDLAILSQAVRKRFNEAGLAYLDIIGSGELDEYAVSEIKARGGEINVWGIGTRLIVAADNPALGGVYKVVAKVRNGDYEPVIKLSDDPEKSTIPGCKTVYRYVNTSTGKAEGDLVMMAGEVCKGATELLTPVFIDGQQVYTLPLLNDIKQYHNQQLNLFNPEYLKISKPEKYPVNFSDRVLAAKAELVSQSMVDIT